ncbi:MAG TPA: hypothetical protein VH021_17005 [Trebonia sp.]|nr:hypothetical protein [Trebonia sp.]
MTSVRIANALGCAPRFEPAVIGRVLPRLHNQPEGEWQPELMPSWPAQADARPGRDVPGRLGGGQ